MLGTKVIKQNENQVIILLDSVLLKSVLTGISVIGKILFSRMNRILKFLTEKNRAYACHLPSESDKPFRFRPHIRGGNRSVSVWTAKEVGFLAFYDDRMNRRNYIDVTKHLLVLYIKKTFDGNDPWYYVQDNAP